MCIRYFNGIALGEIHCILFHYFFVHGFIAIFSFHKFVEALCRPPLFLFRHNTWWVSCIEQVMLTFALFGFM